MALRLLLIEDSAPDRDRLVAMVEGEFPHARIDVEVSLEGALGLLARGRFDLVLADLSLPDAQGPRVVRAVRTAHPETPLLVLTGRVDGDLALWSLAEGAQDYLVKGQHDGPRLATALLHALQRKRAEEETHRYLQLARGLLDALDAPTCAVDSRSQIVAVNRAWREFGEQNDGVEERVGVGVSYLDVCDAAASQDVVGGGREGAVAALVAQGLRHVLAGSLDRFDYDYACHAPGESRWFNVRVTPAVINEARGAVITHHNVTDMHIAQQSLAHQSLHDSLTDLPNRVLMVDRVAQAISDAERRGLGVAVSHLDLSRYQRVNDRWGYCGGDEVLVQVAERLSGQLRAGDTLARSSGDEFLVLWRDLDSPEQALALSEGLVAGLGGAFEVAEEMVSVSASVGVAWHRAGGSVDELLQSANAALYDAKSRGPGQVLLFTAELREAARFRTSIEEELRAALVGPVTELVLHYQPVVDLTSGNVVGVEALVRWNHPVRGFLPPDRFIPIAEASGLIHPLGDWVLEQAVRDGVSLVHEGRELDIAVNFSVRQLDDRAVIKVREALEASGLRPDRLILEVTESAFVEDEETAAATLQALSQLGVKIAIDDFGTGYSSLLYLRRYPITTLKIDREFVAGIGHSVDDEAICGSIISLAAAVGASSIGEGVETAEQYAVLRSLGCLQGQGYLWSPAVPLDQLGAAFRACAEVPVAAPRSRMARKTDQIEPDARALIAQMHTEGASLHTIAAALNRSVGRHPKGVRWTASAVARELAS